MEILSNPKKGNYRIDKKFDVNYYIRSFESLDEFYDIVCNEKGLDDYASHNKDSDRERFTWTYNFDEAVELARNGWEEGLKDLDYYESMADKDYAIKSNDRMLDVELNTTGAYVDVGAYLQGQPECMCDFVTKRTNTFADILINVTTNCNVSTKTIFNRGREIMKLVDALEKAHIKTRIIFMMVECPDWSVNMGDRYIVKVVGKDYNQMLDQNRLIFALAHASFFRRFLFCCTEMEKDIREKFGCPYGGYGAPGNIQKLDERVWKSDFENTYTFLFDDINHADEDIESVKEKVREIIGV